MDNGIILAGGQLWYIACYMQYMRQHLGMVLVYASLVPARGGGGGTWCRGWGMG
jgi:hypothetical protein